MSVGVKTPAQVEAGQAKALFLGYVKTLDDAEADALNALRSIITTAGVKDSDKIGAADVALAHVRHVRERIAEYALAQRQGAQAAN